MNQTEVTEPTVETKKSKVWLIVSIVVVVIVIIVVIIGCVLYWKCGSDWSKEIVLVSSNYSANPSSSMKY